MQGRTRKVLWWPGRVRPHHNECARDPSRCALRPTESGCIDPPPLRPDSVLSNPSAVNRLVAIACLPYTISMHFFAAWWASGEDVLVALGIRL